MARVRVRVNLGLGVGLGAGLGASLLLIADCRCTIPWFRGPVTGSRYTGNTIFLQLERSSAHSAPIGFNKQRILKWSDRQKLLYRNYRKSGKERGRKDSLFGTTAENSQGRRRREVAR